MIRQAIVQMINGREILVSAIFSQFMSNVPAAILLSEFTTNIKALIIGTNIGGLGTLIASMASLISSCYFHTIHLSKLILLFNKNFDNIFIALA